MRLSLTDLGCYGRDPAGPGRSNEGIGTNFATVSFREYTPSRQLGEKLEKQSKGA